MRHHNLVPPEDWVTTPDPEYDLGCPTCSALVDSPALHRAWHLAMVELAEDDGRDVYG